MEIEVDPRALGDARDSFACISAEIRQSNRDHGFADACGDERLIEAVNSFLAASDDSLTELSSRIDLLGQALANAGGEYTTTDRSAMPGA
jgi:hypothetical protein